MSHRGNWIARLPLALFLSAMSACSVLAPRPDPTQFYVLATLAELGSTDEGFGPGDITLGVGPVRFPSYLERSQLATRVSPSRVEYSEWAWWAEPPQKDFLRTLASNLGRLLQTDQVAMYPWFKTLPFDYIVSVEVLRFEATAAGAAVLQARWVVRDGKTEAALRVRESDVEEQAAAAGAEATVESLSRAVGTLSRQIAVEIEMLAKAERKQ